MPRARSADIPRYDTYPAPAPSEASSTPQDWPYEPRTDLDRSQVGNERLNRTAENIGETLGRAVAVARSVPRRFGVIRGGGGGNIADDLKQRAAALGEEARARVGDLRGQVEGRLAQARERALDARRQATQYAHDNPLQIIAGAAVAGLALGIGLRLWRSRHV